MGDVAIKIEGLGKRYKIGLLPRRDTLRDQLAYLVGKRFSRNGNGYHPASPGSTATSPAPLPVSDTLWALKDISFEVKHGAVVGIIGRNGAGKSTLLKILSRITEPTTGYADINGRIGSLLEVGTGFHPDLTGRENIYLNGSILGMKRAEITTKFDEIVAFAEIAKFIDTPVKHYSSGMYVRLAFAVAAHMETEILLVDEVLAVGDAEFQKKCLGKMGDVARQGRTVLFVSHNMAAINSLCQQGVLLNGGMVSSIGPVVKVTDEYSALGLSRELVNTVRFSKPNGRYAWIESVSIRCNDKPAPILSMGDPLTVDICFRSDTPIRKPSVGFVISSVRGEKIVNANNIYQQSPEFDVPVNEGLVSCKLGVLPLMEGRYTISVWFGAHSRLEHQQIEDALSFEVVERDVWGTGKLPTPRISQLWWPTIFEFSNGNSSSSSDVS
jgi:lipopolysaccharide transport system ATP-binding protein